jgi:predicted metalloprotease with PDZ domain
MKLNRVLALAAAVLTLGAAAAPAAPPQAVDYVLAPAMQGSDLVGLDVEIRFTGDADGETRLSLPDRWAGETDYWKQVRDLRIEGAAAREDGPAVRVLTHAPSAPIVVRYRVVSAYEGDPRVGGTPGNPYAPIVRPRWFSAVGHGVFAIPEDGQDRPATFHWAGKPEGWRLASDLDHQAMGARTFVGDIQQSVVMGGEQMRVVVRQVAGADVRVAMLGDWSFTPDQFADMAARVIGAQRAYWREHGETFFIAMTPLIPDPPGYSTGGTGLDDGFAIWAGTDVRFEDLLRLLAHEHMHTWNGRRLGRMPDPEAQGYWFSEGFTDFLTHRVLLGSGQWTLEQFVDQLNRDLHDYDTSPARNATTAEVVRDFWNDNAVQHIPYQRGQLLAWLWDWRLRAATAGRRDLDDVLRAQKAAVDADGGNVGSPSQPLIYDRFTALYRRAGGADLAADIQRFNDRGETLLLPESLFAPCARIETTRRANFARGWDAEATTRNGNVMTGLRDDSPAWRAGLRNGMQIVKREFGEVGNGAVEYGLRVKAADGAERVYRFMPTAPGYQTLQTIVLAPDISPSRRAACVRMLGGV